MILKRKKNVFVYVFCVLMDKRILIMLESKYYFIVIIIWIKIVIVSIMMWGIFEIKINWNVSIVLIVLNVFVICLKNKNMKIY